MKLNKETKVGLLTVVTLVILYFGFKFLKGVDFLNPSNTYYVLYDNVDGLEPSSPVELLGYRIGRVDDIILLQDQAVTRMLVVMQITEDLELYEASEFVLRDSDLLGSKVIEIKVQGGERVLQDGDTIEGMIERPLTEMLKEKTDPLIDKVDTTISNVNTVLSSLGGSGGEIEQTVIELKETSKLLRAMVIENRRSINASAENIEQLTAAFNDPETGIKPFLQELNQLADTLNNGDLSATLANANKSMQQLEAITKRLENGEGSIGKLLANDSLYNALTRSSSDLDKLLIDIQENPERYIDLRFSLIGIGQGSD